jgi:carbonic anhydrase
MTAPFEKYPVTSVEAMLVGCMDKRLNRADMHGMNLYGISNAGGRFSPPSHEEHAGSTQISYDTFLDRVEEAGKHGILAFSGHYDCVGVARIWNAHQFGGCTDEACGHAHAKRPIIQSADRTLAREYGPLADMVNAVINGAGNGFPHAERINFLAKAKVLSNVNTALKHERIAKKIAEGDLAIVAYMEDPTTRPHQLLIYDPRRGSFVEGIPHKLSMLAQFPHQEEKFAITAPVDIEAYLHRNIGEVKTELETAPRQFAFDLPDQPDRRPPRPRLFSVKA